jgi:uroporphyrin-III C-methyltransferase/precorrin-2 dehydrogenase/sirohydrochlorin ferrochelatase
LRQLPALARQHAIGAPALLIIGKVAAMADDNAWFGTLLHDRGAA